MLFRSAASIVEIAALLSMYSAKESSFSLFASIYASSVGSGGREDGTAVFGGGRLAMGAELQGLLAPARTVRVSEP